MDQIKKISFPSAYSIFLACLVLLPSGVSGFAFRVRVPAAFGRCGVTSLSCGPAPTTPPINSRLSMSAAGSGDEELSRGGWVSKAASVTLAGLVAVFQSSPLPASAAPVGEGGLPDGARQFSNLLKAQQDWAALGKTMRERGSSLSQEEWKNVALFLRKVYQLGGELEFLTGQFSADKKKEGVELIRTIQKEVEAADATVRDRNVDGFLATQVSVAKKFDAFMELFNDVPSEL